MKKQYLIGILGIAAISIPMGNSLLSANDYASLKPIATSDNATGLVVDEEASKILVDAKTPGTPAAGDQISSFTFKTIYTAKNDTDGVNPSSDTQLHFYYGDDQETGSQDSKAIKLSKLGENEDADKTSADGVYSYELIVPEDYNGDGYTKILGAEIVNPESVLVTMDNPAKTSSLNSGIEVDSPVPTPDEVELGSINIEAAPSDPIVVDDPVIDSHKAIYDDTNKILEVEGEITTNNSDITDIVLKDDGGAKISADYELGEPDSETTVASYSVWAFDVDLSEPDPAEITPFRGGSDLTIEGYELIVSSKIGDESNEDVIYDFKADDKVQTDDLGGLLDSDDKMGGWAVFGIIVAVALLVGIIGYGGYYLYKKSIKNQE